MKCIILCSGYATRLYPLTLDRPKPLLPIRGKPLLNYLIENVSKIEDIDEIFVVCNEKFYKNFLEWKKTNSFSKEIKIINDGTLSNETRLGGLGDFWFAINKEKIDEDVLLLLGDNFFNFDLRKIVGFFEKRRQSVVGLYDLGDLEKSKNFGVIELKENKIMSFEEKPKNPKSTLISTGIYVYSKKELERIADYMKTDKPKDGPGYLIPYLLSFQDVYGLVLDGFWYDIGSKEVYEEVNRNGDSARN